MKTLTSTVLFENVPSCLLTMYVVFAYIHEIGKLATLLLKGYSNQQLKNLHPLFLLSIIIFFIYEHIQTSTIIVFLSTT